MFKFVLATLLLASSALAQGAADVLKAANNWIVTNSFHQDNNIVLDGNQCRIAITREKDRFNELQKLSIYVQSFDKEKFAINSAFFIASSSDNCEIRKMSAEDLHVVCASQECEEEGCVGTKHELIMKVSGPRVTMMGPGRLLAKAGGDQGVACQFIESQPPIPD